MQTLNSYVFNSFFLENKMKTYSFEMMQQIEFCFMSLFLLEMRLSIVLLKQVSQFRFSNYLPTRRIPGNVKDWAPS